MPIVSEKYNITVDGQLTVEQLMNSAHYREVGGRRFFVGGVFARTIGESTAVTVAFVQFENGVEGDEVVQWIEANGMKAGRIEPLLTVGANAELRAIISDKQKSVIALGTIGKIEGRNLVAAVEAHGSSWILRTMETRGGYGDRCVFLVEIQ